MFCDCRWHQLSTSVWYRFFGKRSKFRGQLFGGRALPGEFLADERVSWHRAIKAPLAAVGKSSDRSRSVSISIWAQKKRHVVVGLPVVRKIDRFRNTIRLAFQACPFQGMGVARTADNHLLAANYNHDVANPRSRITSDGHSRRRKLLSHGRVAKSFPGGTVGISGNRRSLSRPGAAGSRPRARRGI